MAPIRPGFMLKLIRETSLAAALLSGTLAPSALHAQTAAQPGDDEEVRWTLPPPSHLLTKPAPVTAPVAVEPARTETPNPFGGAPIMLQATPAAPEQPSILAPAATLPGTLQPPASPEAPAPVTAVVTPTFAPAPVPAPAPAATLAAPEPASPPVAAAKPDMAKPGAKKQTAKAQGEAKPIAKAKPAPRIAAKPSPKGAEGKSAKAKVAKPARVAAQPVPAPRPEYVPPPPSMLEKEPEESRIPVISTMMDGVSSVGKKIGGLFD